MSSITAFSDQIGNLNKGLLDVELTEAMSELVKQVRDTRKKGSISLVLSVSPLSNTSEDVMKITPDIKLSLPKMPQPSAVFWSTADGDMLRNDPHQSELQFTKIDDTPPSKVIKIQEATK